MNKKIDDWTDDMDNKEIDEIEIVVSAGRSEEFVKKSEELSEYVRSLDLSADENNKLVSLIIEQVSIAERDAFQYAILQALTAGMEEPADQEKNFS